MTTAQQILKQYWGYEHFRPLQQDIIHSVLADKDTLALLPTGGGKSICYQVPALMRDGCCLVISPLIALMQDQVSRLHSLDIPAACLYSGMSYKEVKQVLEDTMRGSYKLLYVSPERLQTYQFRDYLYQMDLNLIAIDEAHCVSQWGHDFRPDYLRIAELKEDFSRTPMLALTATATTDIQQDIAVQLRLKDPDVYKQSFARNNIFYSIGYSENKSKDTEHAINGCSIVYCRSRKQTEAVGRHLQQHNMDAAIYHAGMTKDERKKAQQTWMQDKTPVMVATTAFGMGIDKPDVRTVIHYDAPEHLEAWYQEAGRAGRDGLPSFAGTLYNSADLQRLHNSTELQFPPEQYLRQIYQAVAEYLQIPIGTEPHRYYPFDISDFCIKFGFQLTPAIYALRLLEREGFWTLSESVYLPSTAQFITDRTVLDSLEASHPKLHYIIVGLLRMYNTIFHYPTHIREFAVARQLRLQHDDIIQALEQMHRMGIMEYNRKGEGPQLFFHHVRADSRYIIIDVNRIHLLRQRHEARTAQMMAFLQNTQLCRERFVLNYFGETPTDDCGHCDICRSKRHKPATSTTLKETLFRSLMTGGATLQQLTASLQEQDKEKMTQIIREMMDEGIIEVRDNGILTYKNW